MKYKSVRTLDWRCALGLHAWYNGVCIRCGKVQ